MKNKKIYYAILLFFIIYFIIFFFFLRKDTDKSTLKSYGAFVVGEDAFFLYKDEGWTSINQKFRKNYNWYKYQVYDLDGIVGDYYMIYSGIWNLFDENREKVDLSFKEKFAITTDLKYEVLQFDNISYSSMDNYVRKVLEEYNIPNTIKLTVNNMISIDIDHDSKIEKIYTVTNAFSEEVQPVTFGFIFLVDDDGIHMIYEQVFENNSLSDTCSPFVSNLLNFNNKNYILVSCAYYSDVGRKVILYRYKDKKVKEIISN